MEDVDTLSSYITNALKAAEESAIPEMRAVPRRSWIRQPTLDLINERRLARAAGDYEEEARLYKAVRKEASGDRAAWLTELVGQWTWAATRRLRGQNKGHGRLANEHGELVESDQRADTFAEYLERVQWAIRPASFVDRPQLFPTMSVRSDNITVKELREAACALRDGKAAGPDGMPIE